MKTVIAVVGCFVVTATVLGYIRIRQVQSSISPIQQVDRLADKKLASDSDPQLTLPSVDKTTTVDSAETASYNPLKITNDEIKTLDLTLHDKARQRDVPLLVYLPSSNASAPVIIHSHGLGGTRNTSAFLGRHWAGRGFVAVFVQHPGSDDSIWVDVPKWKRLRAFKTAASQANLELRLGDVSAVIDQLEKWNAESEHALQTRMDLDHIGMSGHSFGAVTTQHVSGQFTQGKQVATHERISAAIPMSPSSPRFGGAEKAFSKIEMPWLCMTGTHDVAAIGGASVEGRLAVYSALPAGDKFQLVLKNAEHSVFTENRLPRDKMPKNPNHHHAIKAISTAFWESYLRQDDVAKNWLREDVRSVLETGDQWMQK